MNLSLLSKSDIQLFLYLNDRQDGDIETVKEILQLPNVQYSIKVLALDRFSRFPDVFKKKIDLYKFMYYSKKKLRRYYSYYNLYPVQKYTKFVLLNILKFQGNIIKKPEYKNIHVNYKYNEFTKTTHRKDLLNHLEQLEHEILECCGDTTVYKFKGDRIVNVSLRQGEVSYTAYKIFRSMWDSIQKMQSTDKEYSDKIYRGISDVSKMPTDFKIGSMFKDEGFSSFSTEFEIANKFTSCDSENSKIFYLSLPKNLKCLFFGNEYDEKFVPDVSGEEEVVLPAGTTYKIVNKDRDKDEVEILDLELVSTHRPYAEGMLNTDIDEKFDKLIQTLNIYINLKFNVFLLDQKHLKDTNGLQQVFININNEVLDLFLRIMVYKNNYRYLYSNFDMINVDVSNIIFKDFFESFEYHTGNDIIIYMYDKKDSKKYDTFPGEFLNFNQYEIFKKTNILSLSFNSEKRLIILFKLLFQSGSINTLTNLIEEEYRKGVSKKLIINNTWVKIMERDLMYKYITDKVITFKLKNGTYKSLYFEEFFPLI